MTPARRLVPPAARSTTPGAAPAPVILALTLVLALALSGCDTASAGTEGSGGDCQRDSVVWIYDGQLGLTEARLASGGIDGWALFFWSLPSEIDEGGATGGATVGDATSWAPTGPEPPWTVGYETKVVFKLSGSGDLDAVAVGPGGTEVEPTWIQPQGSNWERPGNEWGTGWVLPTAGCWEIRLTRAEGSATLPLRVVEEDKVPAPTRAGSEFASAGTERGNFDCEPMSVVRGHRGRPVTSEARMVSDGIDGWAWFWWTVPLDFSPGESQEVPIPWTAGYKSKILFRVTGSGDLDAVAVGPGGTAVRPLWVEPHSDSTWDRPGDEWTTAWIPPAAGCWEIRLTRAEGSASLLLEAV